MDGDIIDQVEPHIREILRICSAVDLEGKELQELNALVEQRSKYINSTITSTLRSLGSSESLCRVERRSRSALSNYLCISTSSQIRSTVWRKKELRGDAGGEQEVLQIVQETEA